MRHLILTLVLLALPLASHAQVIIAPTAATFSHPDAEFAVTGSYRLEFYQCNSVTPPDATNPNGTCVGRAAAPFQTATDVPKSAVTGNASARSFSLTTAPVNGVLSSMPAGVGFVSAIRAVADPAIPGVAGVSASAGDSNPFFSSARTPAVPGRASIR